MMKKQLHIIWDLDGTLINSAPEIINVLDKSISEIGLSEIEPFRSGPPLDKVLKYMYRDRFSEENIKKIVSTFRNNYDDCGFKHTPPYEGIEEILTDTRFFSSHTY